MRASRLLTSNRIVGAVFVVFFGAYAWFTGDIILDIWAEEEPFTPRTLPYLVAAAGVFTGLLLLVLPGGEIDWEHLKGLRWLEAGVLLTAMSAYGFLFDYLGFILATTALLGFGFWYLGERRVGAIALAATALPVGFFVIMRLLDIQLEPGELYYQLFAGIPE